MKNIRVFFLICPCSLFLLHCNSSKNLTIKENLPQSLIIDKRFSPFELKKAYHLDTSFILQNQLIIQVSYIGGCEKQNFSLYTKGDLTKSLPPLTTFYLHSDFKSDKCNKKVKHLLKFDISPFKQRYNKTLRISLAGYLHELTYEPK